MPLTVGPAFHGRWRTTGHDFIVEMLEGYVTIIGERDVSPVRTGNPIIAAVTGDIYREAG